MLTDELREMIVAARADPPHQGRRARESGTRFLRESALELVRAGETTLQEINRVTLVA